MDLRSDPEPGNRVEITIDEEILRFRNYSSISAANPLISPSSARPIVPNFTYAQANQPMKDVTKTLPVTLQGRPDDEPIFFSVKPADGQVNYSVFVDFQGNYAYGNIQNWPLGTVQELRGNSLLVVTLVTDTNPNTNRTGVRFFFNDIRTPSQTADADVNNGTVSYNITFDFI